MMEKKLMIMIWAVLALTLGSCSKDSNEPDNPKNPIENLQLPQSSADNPIKSGATVTINGKGFTDASEIWLKPVTKSTDVKVEITSVTSTSISFIAPAVSGEKNIVLRQNGGEYTLGKMFFDTTPQQVEKRLVKREELTDNGSTFEYAYKNGKIETITERRWNGEELKSEFTFDSEGRLIAVQETDSDITFEYKDAIILAHITYESGSNTITLNINDAGLLSKATDTSGYSVNYKYDANNNMVEQRYYDSFEGKEHVNTFIYDDKISYLSNMGLPTWYWIYYQFTTSYHTYLYDGNNNMVKAECTNANDNISFRFDYDEEGYPTKQYYKSTNEEVSKFTYELIE